MERSGVVGSGVPGRVAARFILWDQEGITVADQRRHNMENFAASTTLPYMLAMVRAVVL